MRKQENNQTTDNERIARRRLLKAAIYTPPAVLGSMVVMPDIAKAVVATLPGGGTFSVSTTTSACNPCNRLINGTSNNPSRDAEKCLKDQCTDLCINCDIFVANAAVYDKTTCDKCEKVLESGCPPPAQCSIDCTCTQRRRNKWRCQ